MTQHGRSKGGRATARKYSHGEHMIGVCPNKQTYSSSLPTPLWDQLLTLLAHEKIHGEFMILFCGKAGSDGQVGGTGFGIVTQKDVQRVINPYWGEVGQPAGPRAITTDPDMTAELAADLLFLNEVPIHVTGIVVREI
jgi:hypothetical protein